MELGYCPAKMVQYEWVCRLHQLGRCRRRNMSVLTDSIFASSHLDLIKEIALYMAIVYEWPTKVIHRELDISTDAIYSHAKRLRQGMWQFFQDHPPLLTGETELDESVIMKEKKRSWSAGIHTPHLLDFWDGPACCCQPRTTML